MPARVARKQVKNLLAESPRFLGKVNPPRVRRSLSGGRQAYAKDNRLIFLFRRGDVMSDGGTEKAKHRPRLEVRVQARRGLWQANPPGRCKTTLKRDGEAFGP